MGATREVVGRNAAARARSSAPDSWLLLITCPTCSVVPSWDARTAILTWSRSLLYPPNGQAELPASRRSAPACCSAIGCEDAARMLTAILLPLAAGDAIQSVDPPPISLWMPTVVFIVLATHSFAGGRQPARVQSATRAGVSRRSGGNVPGRSGTVSCQIDSRPGRPFKPKAPRGCRVASRGRHGSIRCRVASDRRICPPWPAEPILVARCTSRPT